MSADISISITINGKALVLEVPANMLLADLLREHLGLRGTKVSCDQGACGACAVLLDGVPVTGCLTFAFAADGREITTVEGVEAEDGTLHRVQQAFHESGVPQCGFCTPGMVILAKGLEGSASSASPEQLDRWLSANICRCSGYQVFRRALGSSDGARE